MTRRTLIRLWLFVVMVAVSTAGGPVYAVLFLRDKVEIPLFAPALEGAVGGAIFWALFLFVWSGRPGVVVRRLSFPLRLCVFTTALFFIIVATGILSNFLRTGVIRLENAFEPGWRLFAYVAIVVFLLLLALQIVRMIGPQVLVNIMLGKYHRPREEMRIFLFVDLIGSTALARRLGDLGTQKLLSRFFFDISDPIIEHGGEIHAYVGDEAIITWPYDKGLRDARCVRCYFAIEKVLRDKADRYRSRFGTEARIRAGLHGGPVVVGECGDVKSAIVYFGDTVNTTARLEEEAKRLGKQLIVSADLLQAISLPGGIAAQPLGNITLRGHDTPTPLYALEQD